MARPTLYLMIGYPGAGKTTVSKYIHELTGAVHLWADRVRSERFAQPTHSPSENRQLYDHLNEVTAELLASGESVIFDTNFNFYKDRVKLRKIAEDHDATTLVVWVHTPRAVAKKRAVQESHGKETRIFGNMPEERFERLCNNLQPPTHDEQVIEIIGLDLTKEKVAQLLNQYGH